MLDVSVVMMQNKHFNSFKSYCFEFSEMAIDCLEYPEWFPALLVAFTRLLWYTLAFWCILVL